MNVPDLPKTHCVAALIRSDDGPFRFELQQRPLPVPGPKELLVHLSCTGICGTDVTLASGNLGPTREILGHEGVGRVVAHGSGISKSDVKIGQRIGIAWIRDVCGSCVTCKVEGGETRCMEKIFSGQKVDGTFAEYAVVPSRYMILLPEDDAAGCLTDEMVAPILCGGVTAYKSIKVSGAKSKDWIAISGAGGGVGAFALQYAVAMGLRVVAVDGGKEKGEYCKQLGAEHYVDFMDGSVPEAVKTATGGLGVDVAIIAVGSGRAYQQAFEMMAPFGTIVCVGIPPPTDTFQAHPLSFIGMGLKVIGSAIGTREDILEALELVRQGKVKPAVIKAEMEELPQIAATFEKTMVVGKYVINLKRNGEHQQT
ncbi:alcohol dehydrogenase [Halenospora varia]|nr:alcohol dehydrogenase [Halenospora varia]